MTISKPARYLLYGVLGLGLAVIYFPLLLVLLNSFNADTSFGWPPSHFTGEWWSRVVGNEGARAALWTSVRVGIAATAIALVLGTKAAFALARYRFFGRDTVSLLLVLPIALPGIVTGIALNNAFRTILGSDLSMLTVIIGHATFCIVVVFNNVVARL
ncbi:MAG TPA: ABC transporter permease, partial [Pseudonocardia sp.]